MRHQHPLVGAEGHGGWRPARLLDGALDRVRAWTTASPAVLVEPTPDHTNILRRLLSGVGVGANLVNDAHLAALSLEYRCSVVSYDNDFSRFDGVTWERPTA